ncbi:hypothetical protein [Sulfitobacter sp. R18_1]|uniref:hypothetical protein n=1 Tax=Sulfitobacter sp. R18_1 TaxID=2821104 RepID=UPI001AD9F90A|nr:hypothetical protein [Sulfitobacter sp. R18_1]MBO9429624.1 hypothetical protein [Sulfitobacter sp. R18_1]
MSHNDHYFPAMGLRKCRRGCFREAMVKSYLELKERKAFKVIDEEIGHAMPLICDAAAAYLAETFPDPEYSLKVAKYLRGDGPKPRSKSSVVLPDKVSASTLRKWAAAYKRGGKNDLIDIDHDILRMMQETLALAKALRGKAQAD